VLEEAEESAIAERVDANLEGRALPEETLEFDFGHVLPYQNV